MLAHLARLYWLKLTDRVHSPTGGATPNAICCVLLGVSAVLLASGISSAPTAATALVMSILAATFGVSGVCAGLAATWNLELGPSRALARLALQEAELDTQLAGGTASAKPARPVSSYDETELDPRCEEERQEAVSQAIVEWLRREEA